MTSKDERLELHSRLRESKTYSREVISEIQRAARTGIYDIRGFGAKRLPRITLVPQRSRYPSRG